jgi:hypothetical protein
MEDLTELDTYDRTLSCGSLQVIYDILYHHLGALVFPQSSDLIATDNIGKPLSCLHPLPPRHSNAFMIQHQFTIDFDYGALPSLGGGDA